MALKLKGWIARCIGSQSKLHRWCDRFPAEGTLNLDVPWQCQGSARSMEHLYDGGNRNHDPGLGQGPAHQMFSESDENEGCYPAWTAQVKVEVWWTQKTGLIWAHLCYEKKLSGSWCYYIPPT